MTNTSGHQQFADGSPIVVALDFEQKEQALAFVDAVDPSLCRLKVGKEMFTLFGPEFVRELTGKGFDVFLDMKFHDIPNTVAKAVRAAAELGVWMVNVHASGGRRMMEQAKNILEPYGEKAPLLIAVTVLTSMDGDDMAELGLRADATPENQVELLASLVNDVGLDGVVCSAQEASKLKSLCGEAFKLVTPGIRPVGADAGDQRRIVTPEQAIANGSDYLVIGRPITKSDDPVATLKAILATLNN